MEEEKVEKEKKREKVEEGRGKIIKHLEVSTNVEFHMARFLRDNTSKFVYSSYIPWLTMSNVFINTCVSSFTQFSLLEMFAEHPVSTWEGVIQLSDKIYTWKVLRTFKLYRIL